MHLLMALAAIGICSCVSVHAQDKAVKPESRHILLVNKTHDTKKVVNVGDQIRLKLTKSKKVKGHITSIDSTFFTVDNNVVYLNEIEKISTKKIWQQVLGIPLVGFGGFISYAYSSDKYIGGPSAGAVLFGLGLTSIGVGIMLPNYHEIGKSRFILISNKPNLVGSQLE